jgi:DNA recombination protein RmuC
MTQSLIAGAFLVAGVLLGIFIRARSAKTEKALLEQHNRESADAVAEARTQLAQVQAESAARAGFESVAAEREKTIAQLTADCALLRAELKEKGEEANQWAKTAAELNTRLEGEEKNMAEKVVLLDTAKQALSNQFEALAGNILDQKSKIFSEGNQKEIGTLLTPLREQIKEFRDKVEQAQTDSKTGVTKLETLIGTLNGLNRQLSEEARNLTTALRGSAKTQGDWGEFILRDLLEKAGLCEGEQYSFQQAFAGVDGENGERGRSVRTDVVVLLPGGRHLVIDSKVSLTAYTDFVGAETEDARKAALKQHIASVRGHIAGLAKAGYHRLPELEAPDFVVMFVPIEPAFLMALQSDSELWADAYKQRILLVGPTTLLYVIRIVDVLWQQERQARNVRDVMNRGALLYEKFVGFVTDMEMIGDAIQKADQNYVSAWRKLVDGPGNLVGQVQKLKELGIRTNKSIPKRILDRASVDQEELALTAEADENETQILK